MKKPKISDLVINERETLRIRKVFKGNPSVKITINIDKEILDGIKGISSKTGIPYQRLINRLLSTSLDSEATEKSRLDKIESEIEALKKKLAA